MDEIFLGIWLRPDIDILEIRIKIKNVQDFFVWILRAEPYEITNNFTTKIHDVSKI